MKAKAIAIMLGIFLCGTAQAKWMQYGTSPDGNAQYYDPDRISRMPNGDIIVWHKQRYSDEWIALMNVLHSKLNKLAKDAGNSVTPYKMILPEDYSHTLQKHVYDCSLQRYAVASSYFYSNNGDTYNTASRSITPKDDWKFKDILPETNGEKLMNIVCKK